MKSGFLFLFSQTSGKTSKDYPYIYLRTLNIQTFLGIDILKYNLKVNCEKVDITTLLLITIFKI